MSNYDELKLGRDKLKDLYIDGTRLDFLIDDAKNSRNKTGYTGVSYDKHSGKYKASIRFKGKQHYLGIYSSIQDAVIAREIGKQEIYEKYINELKQREPERIKIIEEILNKREREWCGKKSPHKNIYWYDRTQKWVVRIKCNKKLYNFGYFDNLEDAIKMQQKAEKFLKETQSK